MYSNAQPIEPIRSAARRAWRSVGTSTTAPKIIVLDGAGRVIDATPPARALLSAGRLLGCTFDRLEGANRGDCARLAKALCDVARCGHAHAIFCQSDVDGETMEADFVAMGEAGEDRRIIVILKPPHEERRRRIDEAQTGFGLTAAESRLLATLFEGCSVPQAASRLGVARSTARTHLQRIFDKTGARRQGDLLRMVACA